MSLLFKTVPDTNVVLAAEKSKSSTSPNKEYIAHWLEGRVDLLYSEDTLLEYVEKLNSESIDEDRIVELLVLLAVGSGKLINNPGIYVFRKSDKFVVAMKRRTMRSFVESNNAKEINGACGAKGLG